MNEGDTAGGQRGRIQALPAGTDRIAPTVVNSVQFSTGSHESTRPMSRSLDEDQQQQLEQQSQQRPQQQSSSQHRHREQQSQQMQSAGTPTSSSLSSASSSKGLPLQDLQQAPFQATSSHVNNAANASNVQQHPTASSHTLQQQQQAYVSSGSNTVGRATATGGIVNSSGGGGGGGDSNNAIVTGATGSIRTASPPASTKGGTVSGADGGIVVLSGAPHESECSVGSETASATRASTFGVVSEDGNTAAAASASDEKVGTSSGVVVGKAYARTNPAGTFSTTNSALGAAVAGGTASIATTVRSVSTLPSGSGAHSSSLASSPLSKKRIKLETDTADVENDIDALKKLILEHKYMRLRSIKERYNEHVAELFFLQTGGSMMEYPVWRKKPSTPAFTNFIRSYKLEPLSSNLEEAGEALKQQSTRAQSGVSNALSSINSISVTAASSNSDVATNLPQGAEIKIPGVGVTPVAVSTTLPAAVAQLTQQGGTPIIPDRIGIGAASASSAIDRKKQISASIVAGSLTIKAELLDAVGSRTTSQSTSCDSNGPSASSIRGSIGISNSRSGSSTSIAGASFGLQGGAVNSIQQQNGVELDNANGNNAVVAGTPAGEQSSLPGASGSSNGPEQYTNKARQEVFVMQRVQELQKEGLWTEKRLPKVQEPPRPKAHWDYLLEEMVWLAADFAQERKWKKACARKCARMVQKHFQDKALAVQRAEKAQELQLKRIAAFVAKEVKTFWSNAEKLVEYKQQMKLDEKRKKALDQQLSFIVDQTEKYSQQLVEGMNKATATAGTSGALASGSKAESLNSSRISSPRRSGLTGTDDEFCPEAESSDDDEETIAKAEAEAEDGTKDEVAALQKESEMDLDDFLKNLPKDYLENRDKIVLSDPDDKDEDDSESGAKVDEDGDKDFSADEDSIDDEDTIREQEKRERNQDHKKEIDDLNAENEMSIEELKAKYKDLPVERMDVDSEPDGEEVELVKERSRRKTRNHPQSESSQSDEDNEDEEDSDEDNSEGLTGSEDDDELGEEEWEDDEQAMDTEEDGIGLKNLLDDEAVSSGMPSVNAKSQSEKDDMINDAAAIAESIQPKGNTLSSTSVVTPIPILLKHSLREYQHIGLDWLVTMHDRKLNGILADEMGLGKTIQTISLLAHLACVKGNWGPHLIIVPSSVMLNWEMEFKKWCPGFKILTYYGTPKERKMKRTGWTKVNAFHVCITSYKLVIQDHQSFRRKKWKYLILDEAQNIKNFKSQRWQLLLNFQTEQRLLLTGTPLQNNLMELWSLMHFLMPHVFQSHREFKEWFSNPMSGMIEGNSEYNETIIKRLHKVLRPFLLRRLKSEVEKQMPKKYEHVVMCRLSKRQRFLYDDFMSRAKTRETLASGNLLSVINVLMQLRKVCNHPNMFEERPTISPFRMEGICFKTASLVYNMFNYDPFTQIDLSSLNLVLIQLELLLPAYVAHRSQRLCMPKRLIEEIDSTPLPPPRCPTGKLRLHVRIPDCRVQESIGGGNRAGISASTGVRVGTSPAMKTEGTKFVPLVNPEASLDKKSSLIASSAQFRTIDMRRRVPTMMMMMGGTTAESYVTGGTASGMSSRSSSPGLILRKRCDIGGGGNVASVNNQLLQQPHQQAQQSRLSTGQVVQIIPQVSSGVAGVNTSSSYIITGRLQPATSGGSLGMFPRSSVSSTTAGANVASMQRILTTESVAQSNPTLLTTSANRMVHSVGHQTQISSTLAATIMKKLKTNSCSTPKSVVSAGNKLGTRASAADLEERQRTEFYLARIEESRKERRRDVLELLGRINTNRCDASPIYGKDLRETICSLIDEEFRQRPSELIPFGVAGAYYTREATMAQSNGNGDVALAASGSLAKAIKTIGERAEDLRAMISNFVLFVPAVCAPTPYLQVSHPYPSMLNAERRWETTMTEQIRPAIQLLHPIISAMSTQFPDPRLIQYDCGKLQTLDRLLKNLKSEGHRVLIFTQMTRMLDVLEAFLNYHGHIYLRLDGTTKVEQRQVLMERFNNDKRMFAFILSTRSGGVGVNLTGADTVIFYDSDWNPTMDAQAQDRCHRIGQTRDVHIYRLVSEKTIEENILKKANQKRILGDLAIEGGNFTTAYFKSSTTVQDLFTVDNAEQNASARLAEVLDRDRERKERLNANLVTSTTPPATEVESNKSAINVFECALAAAEDDQDVQAANFAKAEASADLDEFDENIPIDEDRGAAAVTAGSDGKEPELSKAEKEVQNLIKQLNPVERYAMRFVEDTEGTWTAVQLKVVEQEIEQQKRDWEANRLAEQRRNEEAVRKREAEEHADLLTFSREDAKNQIWISDSTMEKMPMWCPPTPPQDDNDLYVDHSLTFLYDTCEIIPETDLPAVYVKKEYKRSRSEAGFYPDGRRPQKIRREDTYYAPRSLFDRPTPQMAKMRKEYKLQRYKGIIKPFPPMLAMKPVTIPMKPPVEPEGGIPEWTVYEDMAILNVVQNLQGLPMNLMLISPGHTPNWDLVADIVNQSSRTYRLPKQCRYRYESVILPREEGKLLESPKKQKKNKNPLKQSPSSSSSPPLTSGPSPPKQIRSMRTGQLYTSDANSSFIKLMRQKFDNIRNAFGKKPPPGKTSLAVVLPAALKNPKHAVVLAKHGISGYESPLTPVEIATRRAERILKEKQKLTIAQEQQQNTPQAATQAQPAQQAQQVQSQQHQHVQLQVANSNAVSQATTVVATIQQQQQQPQIATATLVGVQPIVTTPQQVTAQSHVQANVQQQQPSAATVQAVTVATPTQHLLQQQLQIQAHALPQQQQQVATQGQQISTTSGQGIQQATIVVCGVSTNPTPTVATIVQASRGGVQPVVNICPSPGQTQQQTQQIVKAIVASPASQNLLTQQLAQVAAQQSTNAQQQGQPGQPQQVSVVLTTPVTTMSGVSSVQLSSQPQIVSIHQSAGSQQQQLLQSVTATTIAQASSSSIVSQVATGQSIPQVVSVAQLSSVMATGAASSATIQPTQVATLTTSALRAQRIVTPTGTLQEVVLHQRSGSQSPTVVSVSSLGGGLTQAQLQTAQLRLSMAGAQQVSGVVAKSIPVGTVTSAGKPVNTPQIQFYRPQSIRQQLKVLHPGTAAQVTTTGGTTATVLQAAAGQPTIVSPAIIQGNIIQTGTVGQTVQVQQAGAAVGSAAGGTAVVQKVSGITTVTGANASTQVVSATGGTIVSQTPTAVATGTGNTIATVQVLQGQPRMQYIKQLGGTKHMITRPVTENEMQLMVKRQIISQQQQQQQQQQHTKQQLIPQAQIFAQANLQVQQAGTSGGQQIATLVKTTGGTVAATGMTLSQVKPGQLKTISNQSQVRQLQLQQQILAQQRKGAGKMTQITQVAGKAGQPTQVFLQGPKNLASGTTMTMQQMQNVIRHTHQGQIVLGKTGVSRMIPVSMSQQPNRQTIQVVTATSAAQAIAAGNIRAHVPGQNIGTIKVAGGSTTAQQQQVILNAIQSQQSARSNASPVRLQTTAGGSLVAVTMQQPQQVVGVASGASTVAANVSQTAGGTVGAPEASQTSGGLGAGGSAGNSATMQPQSGVSGSAQVVTAAQQVLTLQQQTAQQLINASSSTTMVQTAAEGVPVSQGTGVAGSSSGSATPTGTAQQVQVSSSSVVSASVVSATGGASSATATTPQPAQQSSQQQQQQVSMIKKKQSPSVAK
ncbi:helicase domino [Anopheles nili]|uniref:helicase domino n=1 Tax=Anopheles nili TaxID=185578 RepID=UPI00237AFA87|nr:helicase domino [Anopheles nili]